MEKMKEELRPMTKGEKEIARGLDEAFCECNCFECYENKHCGNTKCGVPQPETTHEENIK